MRGFRSYLYCAFEVKRRISVRRAREKTSGTQGFPLHAQSSKVCCNLSIFQHAVSNALYLLKSTEYMTTLSGQKYEVLK